MLRGGPIKADDIISRFYESNKARFNVQKEMFKNINAAEILGTSTSSLRIEFRDRQLSVLTFNNLRKGKYEPYFPSTDIKDRFKEIAKDLGTFDVYKLVLPTIKAMKKEMQFLTLEDTFDIDLNDYLLPDTGIGAPALPKTPEPSAIKAPDRAVNVDPNTLLTSTEQAVLSPEEKIIRQNLRRTT